MLLDKSEWFYKKRYTKTYLNNVYYYNKELESENKFWFRCNFCENIYPYLEYQNNLYVCKECLYHFPISVEERILNLCDEFQENSKYIEAKDFLNFSIQDYKYSDILLNLKQNKKKESVICGRAKLDKYFFHLIVMDFSFLGGSLGNFTGEKICIQIKDAIKYKEPIVIISASGGARIQEGIYSLMQMAKILIVLDEFLKKGFLYISVLTNPTMGGVTASFASLGDIILAEPKALIGFAGPRVIQKTISKPLPQNFQSAEFLIKKGFIDRIVHRKDLKKELQYYFRFYKEI